MAQHFDVLSPRPYVLISPTPLYFERSSVILSGIFKTTITVKKSINFVLKQI